MNATPSGLLRGHDVFRTVHLGALALCAVMLPWSKAGLSIAQLLLVANWLVEGVVRQDLLVRFRKTFTSAPALVYLSFFGLHIAGLAWTSDLAWGVDLVRILLPVLAFGAVLAGTARLSPSEWRPMLLLGAWSAVVSTFFCLLLRTGHTGDYRSLSVFTSHIRLALLLCFAVVVLLLDRSAPRWLRWVGYLAAAWSVFFINKLGSLQGFAILAVLGAVFLWRGMRDRSALLRWSVRGALMGLPLLVVFWGMAEWRSRSQLPDPRIIQRFEKTAGGEIYTHDIHNPQRENGNHVWTYVAWREMKAAWPMRSQLNIDSLDQQGHPVWGTLVRYLASKGERKDSLAIMRLTGPEVRAIEGGATSVAQGERSAWRERIDEVFFELEHYRAFGKADGHSVAMRLEFLKAGVAIAKANWLVGVGTGDTKEAFAQQYEHMRTTLAKEWRHRAHNQYLTLLISFGVVGLLGSLFAWCWPAWRLGAWRDPYFIAWAIIFGISCLTDDTMETQVGATFFAFYYALFVFGVRRELPITPGSPPAPAQG